MAKKPVNKSEAIRGYIAKNPDCTRKDIKSYLGRRKIECSPALIDQQLSRMREDGIASPKPTGEAKSAATAIAMRALSKPVPTLNAAKRKSTKRATKAQTIRNYEAKHPDQKPAAIIAALAKKGCEVSANNIYASRNKASQSNPPPYRWNPNNSSAAASEGIVQVDALVAAKAFATSVGSIKEAKAALTHLSACGCDTGQARSALDCLEKLQ